MQFERFVAPVVGRRMATFRVVAIAGARQVGKTTLLRSLPELADGTFLSFDRPDLLERARDSAIDLVESAVPPVVIDEYQRAGDDLLLAIKYLVDRDPRRGQFVLAGSTQFLTNRSLSETLAGRIGIVEVLPLSMGEVTGRRETLLDALFESGVGVVADRAPEQLGRAHLAKLVARGGYPEAVLLDDSAHRDFFDAYVDTVVGRESLADVGAAQTRSDLRRLLRLCAARTSQEYHPTTLSADAMMSRQAVTGLVEILATLGLIRLLPAWSTNATNRAKKASKMSMLDTGVATALLGQSPASLVQPEQSLLGPLTETFVANEIYRAASWSSIRPRLSHFRDREGREVDLIAEADDGRLVAIEVKASTAISPRAFDHLRYLRSRIGDRFIGGLVLHAGTETWRADDSLWAAPISVLWS
jgi:uncharacterized protein